MKFIVVKKLKYLYLNIYTIRSQTEGINLKDHEVLIYIRVLLEVYSKTILMKKSTFHLKKKKLNE